MKLILALVVYSYVAYFVHSAVSKEFAAKVAAAKKKCQDEYNTDMKVVEETYFSGKEPDEDNAKCALACVFKEFGYIKDGNINVDAFSATNKFKYPGDEANIEKANKIVKECSEKVQNSGNDCIYASMLTTCVVAGGKKEGLPKPVYEQ